MKLWGGAATAVSLLTKFRVGACGEKSNVDFCSPLSQHSQAMTSALSIPRRQVLQTAHMLAEEQNKCHKRSLGDSEAIGNCQIMLVLGRILSLRVKR